MVTKEISRLVGLVTYANAFLQGRDSEFDIETAVTEHCYGIEFIEQPPSDIAGSKRIIAPDASSWFKHLRENGVKRVRLHYSPSGLQELPDHISVAFVGGGPDWTVTVQHNERVQVYAALQRTTGSHKDSFVLLGDDLEVGGATVLGVVDARERIGRVLDELIEFTGKSTYLQNWNGIFTGSRTTLAEFEPLQTDDYIPYGLYSLGARQLLEAAFRSWVFGGMGSWNDLAFSGDDQNQYQSLSEELYEAICLSIVSAVNSYP